MPSKNVIRVSEFEKLYYDDEKPFKQKHWEGLCRYLESVNKKEEKRAEYFRILNKGIQFTNYVGVIQAGNLTIEVLPKVDKGNTTAANADIAELDKNTSDDKQRWHNVLLQMLRECHLLRVNHVDYANLRLKSHSLLDIYIELFLDETEWLLHEGLLKKYRRKQGNQMALKGQVLFAKQMAYNVVHQERFYIQYTEYNRDNVFNQILYQTLQIIPNICSHPYLLDKVGRLLLDFPEVSFCTVTEKTFAQLSYDRKTERYKEVMLISKMLILQHRPDITGGSESVVAILFDMNKLWEEFVYRRLKKQETNYRITVQRQQSENFWTSDLLSRPKTIRPDIVIMVDETKTIVVDTKWKMVDDLIPCDEDLKQMFTYNLFWDCEQSILLYPSQIGNSSLGNYAEFKNSVKRTNQCGVCTISVLSQASGGIDEGFGLAALTHCIGKDAIELLDRRDSEGK